MSFVLAIVDHNELRRAGFAFDVDPLWALISSVVYVNLRTRRIGANGPLPYVPLHWLIASGVTGAVAFIWILTLSALRASKGV